MGLTRSKKKITLTILENGPITLTAQEKPVSNGYHVSHRFFHYGMLMIIWL